MAAASQEELQYLKTVPREDSDTDTDSDSDDESKDDASKYSTIEDITSKLDHFKKITINDFLDYVNVDTRNSRGLVDTITETYLNASKRTHYMFDEPSDLAFYSSYFNEIDRLTSDGSFKCIHRAVNTRFAELFLINTFYYFYKKVYPNDKLEHFKQFVTLVVDYITQQQGGTVCVFDGTREELPRSFFENVVTGSILAFSILQSRKCRSLKTSMYKLGLKQGDSRLKELKMNYKNMCGFFKKIDTSTYEDLMKRRFNLPTTKGGQKRKTISKRKHTKKNNKRNVRKTHKKKSHKKTHKKEKSNHGYRRNKDKRNRKHNKTARHRIR